MKKFILFNITITAMGGGQIYAKNKIDFMKKNGYDCSIFYSNKNEEVIIEELKMYKDNVVEYLMINPTLVTKKEINRVLNFVETTVGKIDEDTIIECNNIVLGMWGEIIAQRFKCTSYIYIIGESIANLDTDKKAFLMYKRKRKELNGIKEETYKMIFGKMPKDDNYNYYLPLICSNVVEDYKNPILEKIKYSDLNISTIGRLSKPYVPTLINEIITFANNHSNLNITYVMVGDTTDSELVRNIKEKFYNLKNVKLFMTGSIYPIPIDFLNKIDIFISSAGSVRVSANAGRPTIAIDARDYCSIGIFRYNTENSVFRKNEKKENISDVLELLYKDEFYKKINIEPYDLEADIDNIFKPHIDLYSSNLNPKEYYDFFHKKLSFKRVVAKTFLVIFGVKFYKKVKFFIK